MNNIKAIIFDVDGVIFDTERMSARYWVATMSKYGYEMTEDTYKKVMGRNFEGIVSGLQEIYNNPEIDFRTIALEKRESMVEELDKNRIPVLPGVYQLLDFLKENEYKIGIATSTRKERAKERLIKEDIFKYVDSDMYGDEVKNSKPSPEIFLKVAEKLNLKPSQCLVIEDSPSGLKAARDGGFISVNVVDFKEPDEEMKKNTDFVFNDLFEVISWLNKNN